MSRLENLKGNIKTWTWLVNKLIDLYPATSYAVPAFLGYISSLIIKKLSVTIPIPSIVREDGRVICIHRYCTTILSNKNAIKTISTERP